MPHKRRGKQTHNPILQGRVFTVRRQQSEKRRKVTGTIDTFLRQRAAEKGIPFYERDLAAVYKALKYTYAKAVEIETERLLDLHSRMTNAKAEEAAKYNLRFWEGPKT